MKKIIINAILVLFISAQAFAQSANTDQEVLKTIQRQMAMDGRQERRQTERSF